jgi:hypothetical protein
MVAGVLLYAKIICYDRTYACLPTAKEISMKPPPRLYSVRTNPLTPLNFTTMLFFLLYFTLADGCAYTADQLQQVIFILS